MKQLLIAVVLVGVASALAHLHVVAQMYYPVVRVESPEGVVFTAVHEPTSERAACALANGEFLAPFKDLCQECKVVAARCERQLESFEAAITSHEGIPHPLVFAPGVRLAIAGPGDVARAMCDEIARTSPRSDVRCVPPRKPV